MTKVELDQTTDKVVSESLLEVKNLKKYFDVTPGILKRKKTYLRAVDDVNFKINNGETLGIVGESGCGKSTLGNTIVRLLEATEGQVIFQGKDILKLNPKDMQDKRKDLQMIFQDPFSSLNPRMKIFDIIAEPFVTHKIAKGKELQKKVFDLMDEVGLNCSASNRYPHEFSGGQRQRVGIARALALKPKLIICDEPLSALDVSIQSQILNLLIDLQERHKLTYLFISHGLPTVKHISDQVAVMYLGKIVELADKVTMFSQPMHPYTEGLMQAIPIPDPNLRSLEGRSILQGDIPNAVNPPSGCRFHTRCKYVKDKCKEIEPELKEIESNHYLACHFPLIDGYGILKTM